MSKTEWESNRDYLRRRKKENPGLFNFYQAKHRALASNSVPKWADMEKIKEFYCNCPSDMIVDHIVPLRGKIDAIHVVTGLHWEQNLQYLTPADNKKKNHTIWPDMPD